MSDRNNTGRYLAMREAVGMVLRLHGVEDARAAPRPLGRRPLSDALATEGTAPDILGLPDGWHVRVTTGDRGRWGEVLDATERAAKLAGADHPALVCHRRGEPVSRSYVVMSLAEFADLIAGDDAA